MLRFLARRGAWRRAGEATIHGVVWVDDVLFSKSVRKHPPCQGIAGGCVVCLEHLAAAEADQRFWVELCSRLGLCLHPDKRQLCGQRAEYTGFVLDTILGRILMVEDKLAKLLTTVQEWVVVPRSRHEDWLRCEERPCTTQRVFPFCASMRWKSPCCWALTGRKTRSLSLTGIWIIR